MIPPWPHGDPRTLAREIVAGARYRTAQQGPAPKSWIELAFDALRAWWNNLTDPLNHMLGNPAVSSLIGIVVLVAAVAFLIAVVAYFARPAVARLRARATQGDVSQALAAEGDARALRVQARAAAAAGRCRDAAALLWASALRALDERGAVRYDAARTPGEWRRVVSRPAFDAFARDAVVALFGDRGADAALVERMDASYDQVIA